MTMAKGTRTHHIRFQ